MKKVFLVLVVIAILIMAAVYALIIHQDLDPRKAHGSVDIQDSLLSFERAGKIVTLNVDEGSTVRKGDILARLDSQSLNHQLKIQYAQCQAEQALLTQYQNGYLPEEIATAKAAVSKSQSNVDLASITYERNASLLRSKSISKQEYDSARAQYQQAQASLAEAQAQLELMERGYRQEIIASQDARVSACHAQLAYLNYQVQNQGVIVAPFNGTVRSRTHELSDYVGAGETIFALTDEDHKRIRIYLSAEQLRLVKVGQKVSVEVPYNAPLAGTISFISPTAMFTPKSVQTEDLRTDLIYEVRVEVTDSEHVLRFGQAITVYLQGTAPDHSNTTVPAENAA
ncbi:MAG TPA: HlyD family efflux transporter periplasmic adaptor subunit [Candidatus Anaerobiospirillum pullistercoris]|uniref:HlyD family efflux transporter periplasmic adaptor subunit n=1 Tax=Candidatus Anaerobiospirillum pullistercoris TaxID=2838452 RepID=A0A9D1WFL2_9GAMM|nr:HlyD family efflux transporter periplasmic adaptor subunit [Candidatus Anaerobiospirillum pullistercoris]